MFTCRLVDALLASMNDTELSELETSELCRRSPVLTHALRNLSKNPPVEKSVVMELHKIPEKHIGKCGIFVCLFFVKVSSSLQHSTQGVSVSASYLNLIARRHIGYIKSPIGEDLLTCLNSLQLVTPTNRCTN